MSLDAGTGDHHPTRKGLFEQAREIMKKDPALADLLEADLRNKEPDLEKVNLDAVKGYAVACQSFNGLVEERKPANREILDILKRARIFELDWEDQNKMMDDVGFYIDSTRMEPIEYLERAWTTNQRMPFPAVFLGIRCPTPFLVGEEGNRKIILGWLCTNRETFLFLIETETLVVGMVKLVLSDDGKVSFPNGDRPTEMGSVIVAAIPRIVFSLVEFEANVTRETGVMEKRRRAIAQSLDRADVPFIPVPRKYHKILIKGSVRFVSACRKAIISAGPSWKLVHRIDVRSHWWIKVRRGTGPIPVELREAVDDKYIWVDDTTPPLDDDLRGLLARRQIGDRKGGEWMGVLARWVTDYQRGPEDGPYVPAVWRVEVKEPLL